MYHKLNKKRRVHQLLHAYVLIINAYRSTTCTCDASYQIYTTMVYVIIGTTDSTGIANNNGSLAMIFDIAENNVPVGY